MDLFNITFDNKNFTYIDSITIDNKNYVAYMDEDNVYISEYIIEKGDITFLDVTDATYDIVLKELNLS